MLETYPFAYITLPNRRRHEEAAKTAKKEMLYWRRTSKILIELRGRIERDERLLAVRRGKLGVSF